MYDAFTFIVSSLSVYVWSCYVPFRAQIPDLKLPSADVNLDIGNDGESIESPFSTSDFVCTKVSLLWCAKAQNRFLLPFIVVQRCRFDSKCKNWSTLERLDLHVIQLINGFRVSIRP